VRVVLKGIHKIKKPPDRAPVSLRTVWVAFAGRCIPWARLRRVGRGVDGIADPWFILLSVEKTSDYH
jgi:hypothetical protein